MPTPQKFRTAQRLQCKASIQLQGLSGKGKSGAALAIADALAQHDWPSIYCIDTENRSLDLYAGLLLHTGEHVGPFNVVDLTAEDGFRPSDYASLRELAIANGAKVVIMDSISHMWQYKGGVLDMVSTITAKLPSGNKYVAWGDKDVVAEKNKIFDLIRSRFVHTITTVRVKEKMEITKNDEGRSELKSLGEQQLQMPDLKYEPDLVLTMLTPGDGDKRRPPRVQVAKSRYAIFKTDEEYELSEKILAQLREYLEEGTSPEELLQKQHADYIQGVTDYLKADPARQPMWKLLKEQAGLGDTKLSEIPLPTLKILFGQLVN